MQFSIVAILALAGSAFAASDITVTATSTKVYTITSCAAEVTNCPATVSTQIHVAVTTYPAGAAAPSGAAAYGTGASVYNKPSLTGYHGPAYTGAAGQVKVAGALAGVGAVAALLL